MPQRLIIKHNRWAHADNFPSRSLHSLVSVEHETGNSISTGNHLFFCLLCKRHMHLLTKINSTNNLGLRKENTLCTKSFILKKKTKKKEFIKDYFLNNLLKLFLHKAFYERTNYFDHFPLSSIYIWICKSL